MHNWTCLAMVIVALIGIPDYARGEVPDHLAGYKIQPGDLLGISVWNEPELQLEVYVSPDGNIAIPLAGKISTYNKTVDLLDSEITQRLMTYIPDLDVTVTLKQPLGNKVYVIGNVNRPGEFTLNRNVDVIQALTMAGGVTKFSDVKSIKVLRRIDNEQRTFGFNYEDIKKGTRLKQNIMLQSGDVVIVP